MPADKFTVISVQKGPLEGGGTYSSLWVMPFEWEDRDAPHLTRGPVPFKIDTTPELVDKLALESLPGVFELEMGVKVASGNKSKAFVFRFKATSSDKNPSANSADLAKKP